MNRKVYSVFLAFCLAALTNCTTSIKANVNDSSNPVEAISATGGTPQSHAVNGAFGTALVATVTTNGGPASGVTVTFTAPSSGPSGTFSNTSSKTANAITNSNGVATSPAIVANGVAGTYMVTATIVGAATSANFSLTNTVGAPAAVLPTSGTPQSAPINAAFPAPFVVTVVDSGQNPVVGAIVTFTAPATGASGTFSDTDSNTTTATSNSSGVAVSAPFTANGISGADIVTASVAGVASSANFNLTNSAGAPATITATSGTPQSAQLSTAFSAPLVATVLDSASNPVSGVAVTFTAPTRGATGTFADGTATEIDTTNASGIVTSSTFVANANTGAYSVIATVASLPTSADFTLTNRVVANTYVFYLSGQESTGPNFYALAGSVEIDPSGNVLAGEQDYNDGQGFVSPQPSGDTITGGTLTVDPTSGQGELTLITNNTGLPSGGTETLAVQFVNAKHALIMQFDGSATSSGTMDFQSSPLALSGGYAFTLSGVDSSYGPVEFGGVFSVSGGTTLENGSVDQNDNGFVILTTPLSGTLSSGDSFGRGTITSDLSFSNSGTPIALNYYVVSAEVIRIVDVDSSDSVIGSAFGQGTNAANSSNASIGNSVFAMEGSPYPINFATVGMLSTSSTSSQMANFAGVADDNELSYGLQLPATPISGTYSIANNGYGSLTITAGDLGDVSALGVYMTDPTLNLNDPNNTATGLGGALIAEMDGPLPGGTGVLVPQTDNSTASFTGNYAFAAQDFNNFCCEFDFAGVGTVSSAVFNGTGFVNDPFITLGASAMNSGVTFSGTPLSDSLNLGRYTMLSTNPTPNPFQITINGTPQDFDVVIYQASGGQLFWLDEDALSVFLGSLQQQGSLAGLPAIRRPLNPRSKPTK